MSNKAILNDNSDFIQPIRNSNNLDTISILDSGYSNTTTRTTSAESCSSEDVCSDFVYFDWDSNWDRISVAVKSRKIQKSLNIACLTQERKVIAFLNRTRAQCCLFCII